jgi:hypothetical protein
MDPANLSHEEMKQSLNEAMATTMQTFSALNKPITREELAAQGQQMAMWFHSMYLTQPSNFLKIANDFLRTCKGLLPFFMHEFPNMDFALDNSRTPILFFKSFPDTHANVDNKTIS